MAASSNVSRVSTEADRDGDSVMSPQIVLDYLPSLPVMVIGDAVRLKQVPPCSLAGLRTAGCLLGRRGLACIGVWAGAAQLAEQRDQGLSHCPQPCVKCCARLFGAVHEEGQCDAASANAREGRPSSAVTGHRSSRNLKSAGRLDGRPCAVLLRAIEVVVVAVVRGARPCI